MKKNNLYFLIISALVFIFSVTMIFVLNSSDSMKIVGDNQNAVYYTVKIMTLLAFLGVAAYFFIAKKEVSSMVIVISATLLLQLYPLFLRLWLVSSANVTWPITLTFIVFIGYLTVVFLTDIFRTKAVAAEENLKGKEIAVKDESEYFDENGKFIGRKDGK